MTWLDRKLARIANKGRVTVAVPIVFNLALCGLILMMSIEQSFPINEAGNAMVLGGTFGSWFNDVCQNRLVHKLSPFLFYMNIAIFDQDIGLLGCPWRIRNTTFRLVVVCLMSLILLWKLAILLFITKTPDIASGEKPQSKIWKFLYITHYILFFGLIVALILDVDGLWNGYRLCTNNFDTNIFYNNQGATIHLHDNNLVLNLLNIEWRTTMPPWCPKRAIGEGLSTDYEMDNFKIVKQCYLTPWIYMAVCDFGAILLAYVTFKFTSLYLFGTYKGNGSSSNKSTTKRRFRFSFPGKRNKNKNSTKKDSVSMAEFDGNNTRNHYPGNTHRGDAVLSPAYNIDNTLYDNVPPIKYPPQPPMPPKEAMPANVRE